MFSEKRDNIQPARAKFWEKVWNVLCEKNWPSYTYQRTIKQMSRSLSENQSTPHFFPLASWIPATELPVHHRDRSRPESEQDANLSWHVKLWLDQITKLSTINGWAERLSLHTEGCTRFVYRQKPVTLPVSIMQSLIDKIISRFQSHISSELALDSLYSTFCFHFGLQSERDTIYRETFDDMWFSPDKVSWNLLKWPQIVFISPSDYIWWLLLVWF